jgi:hypothetical protein
MLLPAGKKRQRWHRADKQQQTDQDGFSGAHDF